MLNITKNNLLSIALRYLFVVLMLGFIFTAYFAPEIMVAITNQVWAMCGW